MTNKLELISPTIMALIATLFTWLVTLAGASLVFFFKKVNKNIMDAMLSISAGVMIAASFWSLLSPSIDMAKNLGINAWICSSLGFLSGGVMLFLGSKLFNKIEKKRKFDDNNFSKIKRSLLLIISITLHNIPEGLAIGVSFGSLAYGLSNSSFISACMLAFGIGIQNFPEGLATSLPLRREGFSRKKAFFYGQASGFVEPLAGVLGAILVIKVRTLLPFLLSFAAGAMIYVVICEIVPEALTNKRKDLMTLFSLIGFAIMMVLDVALG